MKRKLSILLVLIVTFTQAVLLGIFSATAADKTVIAVNNTTAWVDSTVDVTINVSGNTGIASMGLTLSFDDNLTLIGAENGEAFSDLTMTPPSQLKNGGYVVGSCRFAWLSSDNVTANGTILKLKFQVSANAPLNRDCQISISCEQGDVLDENRNFVDVSISDGYVKIIDYIPGDVDGNGVINMLDVLTLCQYYVDGCQYNQHGYAVDINALSGDVDSNGKINMLDVLSVCQYYVDGCKTNPDGYNVTLLPGKVICEHAMKHYPAKAAECEEDGNIEYWQCEKCGRYFADEAGIIETSLSAVKTEAVGHTFEKYWSNNELYHWRNSTCGHTVVSDYENHDFNENGICTVCSYEKPKNGYKQLYEEKYPELGKAVNLIEASDFTPYSGAKRVFSDELYNCNLDIMNDYTQNNNGQEYYSFEEYFASIKKSVSKKISYGSERSMKLMSNQIFSMNIGTSSSDSSSSSYEYQQQKSKETSEYVYTWDFKLAGQRVDIAEFRDKAKLMSMLSPELKADAIKLKNGELSASKFIQTWGTHVITSAIYGANISVRYYELSHKTNDSKQLDLTKAFNHCFTANGGVGLSIDGNSGSVGSSESYETSYNTLSTMIGTSTSKDSIKRLFIDSKIKSLTPCASLNDLKEVYTGVQNDFNSDKEKNSVLVDVGDSGLCCIWYLLDDSFDDVKMILDDYMYSQCDELYEKYASKIDGLKLKDDITFDNITGTLELDLSLYQKKGTLYQKNENNSETGDYIPGFTDNDTFVSYKSDTGIIEIQPYYNGNQIKRIVVIGTYGTIDSSGQLIENIIKDVSIKLLQTSADTWYDKLEIEFKNVGFASSDSASAIDLTAIPDTIQINILYSGNNLIKGKDESGQAALRANNIALKSPCADDIIELYGGSGATGASAGEDGKDGGAGIVAKNLTIDILGTLNIYGGDGGNGHENNADNTQSNSKRFGGNGGNGGNAISCGSCTLKKSISANGGKGGNGAYAHKTANKPGEGGNGGNGGNGISYTLSYSITEVSIVNYGNGGSGGNGGGAQKWNWIGDDSKPGSSGSNGNSIHYQG